MKSSMKNLVLALFFAFVCWVIYEADQGAKTVFIALVQVLPFGDKLGHACLFGTLALLANWALGFRQGQFAGFRFEKGSLFVLLFAFAEELSQNLFSTRTPDITDALADIVGVVLASLASRCICGRIQSRTEKYASVDNSATPKVSSGDQ